MNSPILTRWSAWLEQPANRRCLYAAIAGGFFVLALVAVSFKKRPDFITSDGAYYYAYLPSLLLDGDLDLTNQADDTPHLDVGYLKRMNHKYPIGYPLTLLPAFLAAHGLSVAGYLFTGLTWLQPNGFTAVYQIVLVFQIMALGLATFLLLDWQLTRFMQLSGAASAFGIVTYWIGSNYAYYYFREPLMVHVSSTFWVVANVTAAAALVARVQQHSLPGWLVGLYSLTGCMAVVCRPTNAFLIPFAIYACWAIQRNGMLRKLAGAMPWFLLGLAPLALQMLFWYATAGKYVHYSYGREKFYYWYCPSLAQTLFSLQRGIFIWSPVLIGAFVGSAYHLAKWRRQAHPWVGCWLVAFLLLWYANSSWYAWKFGDSFGGRAFLELAGFFVMGLALLFEPLAKAALWVRHSSAILLGLAILHNYLLMGLYVTHVISRK